VRTDEESAEMGRLVASYSGCDAAALANVAGLVRTLRRATAAAGATALQSAEERFAPDGFLATIATRESEARLRTIPAEAVCFVEFRFDDGCRAEAFAAVLASYLRAPSHGLPAPLTVRPATLRRPRGEATAAPRSA
jgi:S-adenosylmethionine/arginine decarboxylase-like enzyme